MSIVELLKQLEVLGGNKCDQYSEIKENGNLEFNKENDVVCEKWIF